MATQISTWRLTKEVGDPNLDRCCTQEILKLESIKLRMPMSKSACCQAGRQPLIWPPFGPLLTEGHVALDEVMSHLVCRRMGGWEKLMSPSPNGRELYGFKVQKFKSQKPFRFPYFWISQTCTHTIFSIFLCFYHSLVIHCVFVIWYHCGLAFQLIYFASKVGFRSLELISRDFIHLDLCWYLWSVLGLSGLIVSIIVCLFQ